MALQGVSKPIASATSVAHVASFARAVELKLSLEEIALLNEARA